MEKVMLGVSLYPEQETLEELDAYLKMASSYGFKRYLRVCLLYQEQRKK